MITAWEKRKEKRKQQKKSNSGPHFSEQSIGVDTKQCDSSPIFNLPFFKLLTWRKTLSDDGFHQGYNYEDQSRPE